MLRTWSRKGDPLSERARALTEEIAVLESQIRQLGRQLSPAPEQAKTAPGKPRPAVATPGGHPAPGRVSPEIEVAARGRGRVAAEESGGGDQRRYNELGARKFDLPDALRRLHRRPNRSAPDNPRLINYLAAGSIQGLRPLRYEKRVARNRVLALSLLLLFVLWGMMAVFVRG